MTVKKHIFLRILESFGFSFSCLTTFLLVVFIFVTYLSKTGADNPGLGGIFYVLQLVFLSLIPIVLISDLILGIIYFLFISKKENILTKSMQIIGVISLFVVAFIAGRVTSLYTH